MATSFCEDTARWTGDFPTYECLLEQIFFFSQSISQHPKLSPYVTSVRNEQIAMHFNDKLTSMEYILYNVAVVESDIYNGCKSKDVNVITKFLLIHLALP